MGVQAEKEALHKQVEAAEVAAADLIERWKRAKAEADAAAVRTLE